MKYTALLAAALLAPIAGAGAAMFLWWLVMVQLVAPLAAYLNAIS